MALWFSTFGAIKHKLAEQSIRAFAVESALYRTTDLVDRKKKELLENGKSRPEALMGAAEEYAIECAILKVFGSEVLDYVVDEGVQILGGYGFSEEYPLARAYRDSRINRIFEGTNEINRLLTVDMFVRKAMKGQLDLLGPAKEVQDELMGIPDFGDVDESTLAFEKRAVIGLRKAILMTAGAAFKALGTRMDQEQEIVMAIADMAIELFISESMVLRVQKLMAKNGESATELPIAMCQAYIADSLERAHLAGKKAINGFADGDMQPMMLLGIKRFTKPSPINTIALRRKVAEKMIAENQYCF